MHVHTLTDWHTADVEYHHLVDEGRGIPGLFVNFVDEETEAQSRKACCSGSA